jgi:hypothetical protein
MRKSRAERVAPSPQESRRPSLGKPWRWLLAALLFLVPAGLTYYIVGWHLRPTLPTRVVGDWRIEGGDLHGARLSFARDGAFKMTLNDNRQFAAVVEMQGDTLRYTFEDPATKAKQVKVQEIKSLTDQEMVVEENRQRSRLVRVRAVE